MIEIAVPDIIDAILPAESRKLAKNTLERVRDAELRVATAESCTAGLLAAVITNVEGCGHVFDRGFVTYELRAKCEMLGLAENIVEDNAAVNPAVAEAMADAALAKSNADLAIGVTGFAGKCKDDQEEGLVFIGCATKGRSTRVREEHYGANGRDAIRQAALHTVFEMMNEAMDDLGKAPAND